MKRREEKIILDEGTSAAGRRKKRRGMVKVKAEANRHCHQGRAGSSSSNTKHDGRKKTTEKQTD